MITDTYSELGIYQPSIAIDPDAILDYTFDWTAWLDAVSDSIASKTITVENVEVHSSSLSNPLVVVWLKNAAPDTRASCTCSIVTAAGRHEDRTIYLPVGDR